MKIRLNKFLSNAGITSRRKADELIASARVRVNGKVVKELGITIDDKKDKVELDGKEVKGQDTLYYIALYKPVGYVVSRRSFPGQKNVYELLPENVRKAVWPIGRLDKDSEGLLFFTNDGDLTQKITHPSFGHKKTYVIRTNHELSDSTIKRIASGVKLEEGKTAPSKIERIGYKEYTIVLREGKNRQIRRMIGSVGAEVVWLKRLKINNFSLGDIKVGQWKFIQKKDIVGA